MLYASTAGRIRLAKQIIKIEVIIMIIGFMRNDKTPTLIAKLTAMLCQSRGVDLIYLNPGGVDTSNNTVNGKMLINDRWVDVCTELPILMDVAPTCFNKKNRSIMEYLRDHTTLTEDKKNRINKERLQRELSKDKQFAHLVIPTMKVNKFHDIDKFLAEHSSIVMKPVRGERGRNIYILRKDAGIYVLGFNKQEKRLSRKEMIEYYKSHMKNKKYILQKYITSRTEEGNPFDCRIHVQKGHDGKWQVARNYIRIGIGQKVISNANQGGGISDLSLFLKANFNEQWEDIHKKINQLAVKLPYKIEAIKETPMMSLGFDVAIDKDGSLYLFEANTEPTTSPLIAQSAKLRIDYYLYLLENEIGATVKNQFQQNHEMRLENELKQLKLDVEEAKQEKALYEKRYTQILNSRAWRATAWIRKWGSFLKNRFRS